MHIRAACILIPAIGLQVWAADDVVTGEDLGAEIKLPTFEARVGIGFNYDLLRDPLNVSFEYPKGYFGMNLPLEKSVNVRDYTGYINPAVDSLFSDSVLFTNGDEFKPTAGARQNPNPTVRVDVPMMGGVASFSSTQNFFLDYRNTLGNPNIFLSPDSLMEGVNFILRGTVNMPLSLTASWETMTFGYAFEVNRYVRLALNLHRHVFMLDMRGKIDVDLLGRYDISVSGDETSDFAIPDISGELDYSSDKINGAAYGHYEAEIWSPTIACKAWRFSVVGRFGFTIKAPGSFYAKYELPFFIDPESGEFLYDLEDPDVLNSPEMRQGLTANATDSIVYSTRTKAGDGYRESDLIWKMPTGLTLGFEIVPEKLTFSYTKLFGEVAMKLDRIAREQVALETGTNRSDMSDSIVIDYGISVDHVMLLEINLFNSFLNLGIFGMDFRYGDQSNLLGSKMTELELPMKLGKSAMLPVLSMGTALGTKIQLLLELDILPLPAFKTGVYYYF
ncbi:MAG: hypothetical protein JXA18_10110 [Chitinispirillaceae bacterium]|nr:hypothetical protein [Chitinispirillaceae bacterium]